MFKPIIPTDLFIARQNIKQGDAVIILWKQFVRPCSTKDYKIKGIAMEDGKKGQMIRIYRNLPGLEYEVAVKK